MSFTAIFIVAAIVILAIVVLILKLAVRWMARLTIIGIILIALLAATAFWWWTTCLVPVPRNKTRSTATSSTRHPSP